MDERKEKISKALTSTFLSCLNDQTIQNGELLDFVDKSVYEAAMKFANGNQVHAAKILGISRGKLRAKLVEYFDTTLVGGLYHKNPRTSEQDVILKDQQLLQKVSLF